MGVDTGAAAVDRRYGQGPQFEISLVDAGIGDDIHAQPRRRRLVADREQRAPRQRAGEERPSVGDDCGEGFAPPSPWARAFALVEQRSERAFVQRAEAIGLRYNVASRIEGYNISQGRAISIAIFRSEGTE